ncbi:carboxypeptidase-like regulatory domain-containing protein [Alsobacter sp. KACC 23698]|uniref:Carboxypeptidase-like regulatory domain-containing protein n=1 Tax=Alsobacter sp. KACC 23698 TaxID=3149229 RepID=A0AAU7JBC9_9HYPH
MASGRVLHVGRVVRGDGMPAAGALVWVASGTAPTPEIAVVCDGEGRFRLALPPGRFEIRARAGDGAEGAIEATAGTDPLQFEIEVGGPELKGG